MFTVFGGFSKFSWVLGRVRIHSDPFGSIRIHSDALGGVRKRLEAFGRLWIFLVFSDFFHRFQTFSDVFTRFWTFSDVFGRVRTHSDVFGCIPTCSDVLGYWSRACYLPAKPMTKCALPPDEMCTPTAPKISEMCALKPFSCCLLFVALAKKTTTGFAGNHKANEIKLTKQRKQEMVPTRTKHNYLD